MIAPLPYGFPGLAQAVPTALKDSAVATAIRSLLQALDQGFKLWAKIINGNNAYLVPTGTLSQFAQANPGVNWLACNGGTISASQYPDLVALIGTTLPTKAGYFVHI